MKKITMILTNAFEPDVRVYKEAIFLKEKGYSIEILALDRKEKYRDRPIEIIDGIKVVRFFCRNNYQDQLIKSLKLGMRSKKIIYLIWYLDFIREIRKYLKHNSCEYLHCHDLEGIVVGYFARSSKTPLIFDMHEYYEMQSKAKQKFRAIIRHVVNYFQDKSYKIIYVHDIQIETMKMNNKNKLVFVPNYVDPKTFSQLEHVHSDILRINFIGSVNSSTHLYEILFKVSDMIEDISISVYGDGPGFDDLKMVAEKYPKVKLMGHYDARTEQTEIYNNTDISYVIYDYNGNQPVTWNQPNKFFEAIFTCTPIIVQEKTFMGEFSTINQTGFAVNTYDINSVYLCILKLKEQPNLIYQARENIKKIKHLFDWNYVVQNLCEIYKR